ncbi:MAG: tol-pal system-associated acyl-CoA thioesterase [Rickettsiales bacterium]|nr:tol-pal system-associated acyl-CoA thioesterase [Rickettsiales bacterium]
MNQEFKYQYRVYYEDTDAGGIVYHSNYLKFAERARTDMLREIGLDQSAMLKEDIAFVVRRIEADYLQPAQLDDMLAVSVVVEERRKASMTISQTVTNQHDRPLFRMSSLIACIRPSIMKPVAMPDCFKI